MDRELAHRIGERLRTARHACDLSLSQLSRLTGDALSKSRISNYEQGIRQLGKAEAQILAEALGTVSADYLLCQQKALGEDPDEERLLLLYRAAPPELRPELLDVLRDLVHPPTDSRKRRTPIDAVAAQQRVAERWPELVLDASTYSTARRIATWVCRLHGEDIKRPLTTLLTLPEHPCPACRARGQRRARAAERADLDAEASVGLIAARLDERAAEIYQLWLAGETLSQVGRAFGISPQAVDQRMNKIRRLLRPDDESAG